MAQTRSTTAEDLARLAPFSSLAPATLAHILQAGHMVELRSGQRFSAQTRDPQGESYCFVLTGQVAIVLAAAQQAAIAGSAETKDQDGQYIGAFGPGDLFSDSYRDIAPGDAALAIDCVATTASRLLVIPAATLYPLLRSHPDWAARLSQTVGRSRQRFLGQQEPSRRVVQDFYLRRNYGTSRRVRVAEVSHCLDCNKCEQACARRHGHARMSRSHAHLGRLAIQRFCVNCSEQACLAACAFGGLEVNPAGEILVTPNCNGCGACARKCPFSAIELIEVPEAASQAQAVSRGKPRKAIKCDNCAGFSDRACLRACPTGTMIELPPQELFFEKGPADQPARFSAVAFVEGVAEHRARAKRRGLGHAIFAWVMVLALIGVGAEILLRRYWPAQSLGALLGPWFGDQEPVSYKPSRGYGHWLGYVGTVFMLLTLFYPLRTRCGVLKNWGVQSTWLSVHLWVGFIGATLVTYHSALKLDRWVGLACYSMWLVVLSGVMGRYLYGMLRSGLGQAEFQRTSLRTGVLWGAVSQNLGPRCLRLLAPGTEKPGFLLAELFVMLWHELRDFLVVLWLRFGGLRHLPTREARHQTVQLFAELASYRRSWRYLASARRLVRYWNWVHIVLTIAMFVLSGFHITYGFMYKAV